MAVSLEEKLARFLGHRCAPAASRAARLIREEKNRRDAPAMPVALGRTRRPQV